MLCAACWKSEGDDAGLPFVIEFNCTEETLAETIIAFYKTTDQYDEEYGVVECSECTWEFDAGPFVGTKAYHVYQQNSLVALLVHTAKTSFVP